MVNSYINVVRIKVLEEALSKLKNGTMHNLADLRLDLSEVFKPILF